MLDFIGKTPNLYIKDKLKYKTRLGGFLCGLMVTFVLAASAYFSKEVWEKRNPIVNSVEMVLSTPQEILWDKEDFEFVFTLRNNNDYVLSPSVVRITPYLYTFSKLTGEYMETPISLEICSENSFTVSNLPLIHNLGVIDKAFCLPKSELSKGIGIYKNYGEDGFKMIHIQFFPCTNSTTLNVTCETQENIDVALSNLYLTTFLLDYAIDTNNYTILTQRPSGMSLLRSPRPVSLLSIYIINLYM